MVGGDRRRPSHGGDGQCGIKVWKQRAIPRGFKSQIALDVAGFDSKKYQVVAAGVITGQCGLQLFGSREVQKTVGSILRRSAIKASGLRLFPLLSVTDLVNQHVRENPPFHVP